MLVGCMTAFAGSDIKVVDGDKKFLKTAEGNAVLVINWDDATYDDKMPLAVHFSELENLKKIGWSGFAEEFNDRSKKVKVVKNEADAKYKFTLDVKKMDQYFKVMGFIPGNATKVWGTLTVTDLSNGNKIAVIDVKEVDGGANPSPDGSFSDCFEELGKQVSKLK